MRAFFFFFFWSEMNWRLSDSSTLVETGNVDYSYHRNCYPETLWTNSTGNVLKDLEERTVNNNDNIKKGVGNTGQLKSCLKREKNGCEKTVAYDELAGFETVKRIKGSDYKEPENTADCIDPESSVPSSSDYYDPVNYKPEFVSLQLPLNKTRTVPTMRRRRNKRVSI